MDRVRLSGDREGAFLVAEERADGSLVLIPDRSQPPPQPRRAERAGPEELGPLAQLLSRRPEPVRTTHEALEAWGVELLEDEFVVEFTMADVDEQHGFVALTNRRFIFLVRGRRAMEVREVRPLEQVVSVERMRRGWKSKLVVAWQQGAATVIDSPDRAELERLKAALTIR